MLPVFANMSQHMPEPVCQNACLKIRGYAKLASFRGSSLSTESHQKKKSQPVF